MLFYYKIKKKIVDGKLKIRIRDALRLFVFLYISLCTGRKKSLFYVSLHSKK